MELRIWYVCTVIFIYGHVDISCAPHPNNHNHAQIYTQQHSLFIYNIITNYQKSLFHCLCLFCLWLHLHNFKTLLDCAGHFASSAFYLINVCLALLPHTSLHKRRFFKHTSRNVTFTHKHLDSQYIALHFSHVKHSHY
jgi:hypothetical protein